MFHEIFNELLIIIKLSYLNGKTTNLLCKQLVRVAGLRMLFVETEVVEVMSSLTTDLLPI